MNANRLICSVVFASLMFGQSRTVVQKEATTKTYTNGRFHYSVEYPTQILAHYGFEPTNGDGRKFQSKDHRFTMSVWGHHNALFHSLAEELAWQISTEKDPSNLVVTYKVLKDNWIVYSGVRDGTIIYVKSVLQDDIVKTIHIEYPVTKKDQYDSLVHTLVRSFKTWGGGDF